MKKLLALILALTMVLALAACGGGEKPVETKAPETDPPVHTQPTPTETAPVETDPAIHETPQSLEIPVDQYPFLASLVLPDDGAVTSIDDQWYAEDGIIEMIVKPMTFDKVAAYRKKLEAAGYKPAEVSGLVSPDYKFELTIGDMWVDSMGYMNLTIYDTNSDGGNSLTGLANLEIADGPELPAEVAKYVGTFDYAYTSAPGVVVVGLRNVEQNDYDRLTDYYSVGGGVLDEALSTDSEQVYTFSWGSVRAAYSSADEEVTLEITIN